MMTPEEGFKEICALRSGEDAGVTNMSIVCRCVFGNYTPVRASRLSTRDVYNRLDSATTISEFEGLVAQLKLEVSDE